MSSSAQPRWNLAWRPASLEAGDAVAEVQLLAVLDARRQLEELARMRAVGMGWVGRLQEVLDGKIDPTCDPVFYRSRGFVPDFVKIARAVRQIMVLQLEIAGLRAVRRREAKEESEPGRSRGSRGPKPLVWRPLGPPPDDSEDFYDFRPVGEAVDWIRKTLCVEAPADDPFREPEAVAAEPEPIPEPVDDPPAATDVSEPEVSEPEACAQAPAATEKRVRVRTFDIDLRDLAGEDLQIAAVGADATARGPP